MSIPWDPSFFDQSVTFTRSPSTRSPQGGANPTTGATGTYSCLVTQASPARTEQGGTGGAKRVQQARAWTITLPYASGDTFLPTLKSGDAAAWAGRVLTLDGPADPCLGMSDDQTLWRFTCTEHC